MKTSSALSTLQHRLSRLLERRSLWRALGGAALGLAGLITLISLFGLNSGGLFDGYTGLLRRAFGTIGAAVLCLATIGMGIALALNALPRMDARRWIQLVAFECAFFSFLALAHTLAFENDPYQLVRDGAGGGAIGWVLAAALWNVLGIDPAAGLTATRALAALLWLVLFALSAFYAARPLLLRAPEAEGDSTLVVERARRARAEKRERDTAPVRGKQLPLPEADEIIEAPAKKPVKAKKEKEPEPVEAPAKPAVPVGIKSNAKIIKDADLSAESVAKKKYVPRPDTLPPLDLLKRVKEARNSDADARHKADVIETTLAHFGLVGKVVEIRRGPTVTQFGIEPGYVEKPAVNGEKRQQKIRVGQIANLQNDFALALAASSIRIEAPIPGRSLVGIEVPNGSVGMVDLRALLESETFRGIAEKSPLAIALGKDVSGSPICADLARMPHLLIAGTTGSGKSAFISALTMSLVMNNRPEDLKLVMIDPKMVELSRFVGLPHIIGKPESDMTRLPAVLKWVVNEMERRYKEFAKIGSRNLQEYNDAMKRREEEPFPRIVVLIDELADMMMQSPIETEKQICRLAQMARATGIHMVVATQRPSVDVVTGLIKANFPSRISFAVASAADSRVILDQVGAESLLGRGDMLYMNPESGAAQRVQGCWVSEVEVEKAIRWWKNTIEAEKAPETPVKGKAADAEEFVVNRKPEMETPWEMVVAELAAERATTSSGKSGAGGGMGDDGGDDELIQKAMDIIRTQGNVSTSLLQRKLRIGYPRAARLMEDLQEMGYVGAKAQQAGKGREVTQPVESEEEA
jgi:DNA segregation ATPase FtsK/SpoIIIE, S-DNA-T family